MYKLALQNVVVLGSLNPAILQPSWLVKCSVIPKDKEVQWRFPVGAVIAPVYFEYDNYEWVVGYDKLELKTKSGESFVDLGKILIDLFQDLKHTPIRAVGHNFIFDIISPVLQAKSIIDDKIIIAGENFLE